MADTYTKLFSSITESTVWGESYPTRIVWVAMLAMADASGQVYAAVPGLARRANVTVKEAQDALDAFMQPDPWSRTPDNDGRRIECIDGGWRLLNHGKYRALRSTEERRAAKREWDRNNRPSGHARAKQSERSPIKSDKTDQSGPTSTSTSTKEAKATVHSANAQCDGEVVQDLGPVTSSLAEPENAPPKRINGTTKQSAVRFPEFWASYPVKKGRAQAEKSWRAKGCDAIADEIIAHVRRKSRFEAINRIIVHTAPSSVSRPAGLTGKSTGDWLAEGVWRAAGARRRGLAREAS